MNEFPRHDRRGREADGALLKRRLANKESLLGVWIETGSAVNAELLAWLGFDFLLIDLEHGQGDINDAIAMLRAGADAPCVVRVPSADPIFLKRILDAGASALMVPSIESAARGGSRRSGVPLSAARQARLRRASGEGVGLWQGHPLHAPRP